MSHITFSSFVDKNDIGFSWYKRQAQTAWLDGQYKNKLEDDNVIISQEILAWCCDQLDAMKRGNFVGHELLQGYKYDVHDIEWSNWNWKEKKARVITSHTWNVLYDEIMQELIGEMVDTDYYKRTDLVRWDTGVKWTPKEKMNLRNETNDAVTILENKSSATKHVQKYMNERPAALFNDLDFDAAYEYIEKYSGEVYKSQKQQLKLIEAQPKPYYKMVTNSDRAFSLNLSFLHLKADVRRVLCKEWIEMDLTNAHLGIVASLWNLPQLTSFLMTNQSFWQYLSQELNIALTTENKKRMKIATYCIVYGAGEKKILEELEPLGVGKEFFTLSLIKELMTGRNKQFKKIFAQKGGLTMDNRFIKLGTAYYDKSEGRTKTVNAKSVLAQQAQCVEMMIMESIVCLAEETDSFQVASWEHDGCSIKPRDERQSENVVEQIKQRVQRTAKNIGMEIISIEVKKRISQISSIEAKTRNLSGISLTGVQKLSPLDAYIEKYAYKKQEIPIDNSMEVDIPW